ncbi:EthD domain-containing protein [Pseudomonas serbica]|uniref:EthD domain-containing protein n=1 Tax=Pseudomonas serbica TaxID=2965074 RepID=UPI00237B8A4C|nr:EthD domain-containing protein [Pseudomonas serbica]
MEKIILTLWKPAQLNAGQWRADLLGLRDALVAAGAKNIRVMLVDEAVAAASAQRITNSAAPLDGMLSLWLDSASQWPAIKTLVAPLTSRLEAYLVVESEPYPEERQARSALYQVPVGQRTPGMNQVALLHKPDRMSYEHWHDTWRNGHGPNAYPLQSIFGYRQNTVVRALTFGAPVLHAIVEENFPPEAIGNPQGFFAALGDPEKCAQRQQAMYESTSRFIDFEKIDCILTSEYQLSA